MRELTPSPPLLIRDEGSPDSSNARSLTSTSSLASPPPTACSTIAVLGSAGLDRRFEDEYDYFEANPNFIRYFLQRSQSLRRMARMRDGDFRDTDEELDYSVTEEEISSEGNIYPPPRDTQTQVEMARTAAVREERVATVHNAKPKDPTSRATSTPSRLSQRVKPPPAIDTHKKTLRNGARYESSCTRYEIEGGYIEPPSEAGFEADDEADVLRQSTTVGGDRQRVSQPLRADAVDVPSKISIGIPLPVKRSYAAVLASSIPQVGRPVSRAALAGPVVPQRFESSRRDTREGFAWEAFVEPVDE